MTVSTIEGNTNLDRLEQQVRENKLTLELRTQEAQIQALDRALALDASRRSFGSAGDQEVLEGLYSPEDYVDINDYRRDNYGYQAHAATFTSRSDRQDGRNWPYWVSEPELSAIRGTVRLLAAYNKTCFGVLNKLRNYTIADGFTRKVVAKQKDAASDQLIKDVEQVLDAFDDLNRITNDLDQEALVRSVRDGEVAAGLWHRGEGHVDLRIVEPDQISEPTNQGELEAWLRMCEDAEQGLPFASNWSFGIHTTKGDVGAKHGYYVQWDSSTTNWDYMPGGNQPAYPPAGGNDCWLEFLKANTDRNIKRGVSDFWAVTGDVELARKMIRNLAHAGALQTAIAWIRELAPGSTPQQVTSATMAQADWATRTTSYNGGAKTTYQQTYNPGTTLYLGQGQKFVPPPWMQQSVAGAMVEVFEAMLRSIAQIWSMPEHMITGSAQNNNYASILEAGSPFVKEIETRQSWHARFWKEIFWRVVLFAWRAGRVGRGMSFADIKSAVDIVLSPPQVDVRDRAAETNRNLALMSAGVMSPVEAAAREGLDYDDQVKQGATSPQQASQPGQMGGFGDEDMLQAGPEQMPPQEELFAPEETPQEEPAQEEPEPDFMQELEPDASSASSEELSGEAPTDTNAKYGLNGAQITAALELLGQVSSGALAPRAASELLVGLGLSEERAGNIIQAQAELPPQQVLQAKAAEASAAKAGSVSESNRDVYLFDIQEAWTDEARAKALETRRAHMKAKEAPKAPHVKKSLETRRANKKIVATKTPEFKRWFGNSKVVDDRGEPLVVYHGTGKDFNEFKNPYKQGTGWDMFTTSPEYSNQFAAGRGASVMPTYLSLQHPLDLTSIPSHGGDARAKLLRLLNRAGMDSSVITRLQNDLPYESNLYQVLHGESDRGHHAVLVNELQRLGYDGIKFNDHYQDIQAQTFIVFDSRKIKSATGNRGTFDTKSANINEAWTDEARAKALETRRANKKAKEAPKAPHVKKSEEHGGSAYGLPEHEVPKVRKLRGHDDSYEGAFVVAGHTYSVNIYGPDSMLNLYDNFGVNVEFSREDRSIGRRSREERIMGRRYEALNDTTSGEAVAVFRRVGAALDSYLKKHKPEKFFFSGDKSETSRVELYHKFAKFLSARYGYTLRVENDGPYLQFTFTKKKLEQGTTESVLESWSDMFDRMVGDTSNVLEDVYGLQLAAGVDWRNYP